LLETPAMPFSRPALRALGSGFLVLAAGLAVIAVRHMAELAAYGEICGGARPHCPACPAAVAAALLGVTLLLAARRRRASIKA